MNKLVDAYHETLADGDHEPVYDPDAMFKPLNPELEYVDVTEFDMEMAHRLQTLCERLDGLEALVRQQALNMLSMAENMTRVAPEDFERLVCTRYSCGSSRERVPFWSEVQPGQVLLMNLPP